MAAALIALGSNLGDRERILNDAVAQLSLQPGIRLVSKSRWHETRPVGGPKGQADFLNGAVLVDTSLSPEQLAEELERIETAAGRTREGRWAARTLDLDLLLYGEEVIDTPRLVVPHPRMTFRRFVLEPAAEIAPSMRHPTVGWTLAALRDHIQYRRLRRVRIAEYVAATAGPIAAGKTALANTVAAAVNHQVMADPVALDWNAKSPRESASLAFDRQLLRRRADQLAEDRIRPPPDLISDYWLEQSICMAELALPHDWLAKYLDEYHGIVAEVTKPKLLVLLDVPPEVSLQRINERGGWCPSWLTLEWLARYRELLLVRVATPRRGPVLRLDGTKPDEAREELVAAIQAMQ
ncbi:MAG TPA: 2-amino-4-hydroxy-6-hydroxymethyldihydropteridine diphosphokinase [Pirellulales bacterium]|jgi:2-amino-4-hydroxy-6-hydroxymethyldihydropteridine diphosphokinase|nr:2-amino-4-hydroxy-6-hydroxymethyldihydropteridine diphosphokinase [Pirellulales bacterium]